MDRRLLTSAEIDEAIESLVLRFLANEMTETVLSASIYAWGKRLDELETIVKQAQERKLNVTHSFARTWP
jgi:hypothetical protein